MAWPVEHVLQTTGLPLPWFVAGNATHVDES